MGRAVHPCGVAQHNSLLCQSYRDRYGLQIRQGPPVRRLGPGFAAVTHSRRSIDASMTGGDDFVGVCRQRSSLRVACSGRARVHLMGPAHSHFLLRGGVALISIDERYVESAAPNADATKNGRGLVIKGKFLALHIDADETSLFGQCQGSGKEPVRLLVRFRAA